MIVIALLLIVLAVVITVGMVQDATEAATLEVWGLSWSANTLGVFLLGVGTALALALGLALLLGSLKRAWTRRAKKREAERNRRAEVERLASEKAALEERLNTGRQQGHDGSLAHTRSGGDAERHESAHLADAGATGDRPDRPSSTARETQVDLTQTEQRERR